MHSHAHKKSGVYSHRADSCMSIMQLHHTPPMPLTAVRRGLGGLVVADRLVSRGRRPKAARPTASIGMRRIQERRAPFDPPSFPLSDLIVSLLASLFTACPYKSNFTF